MDANTAMVTFAQKGGESHTREIHHAQYEETFRSYTTAKAGEVADPSNVQVRTHHAVFFAVVFVHRSVAHLFLFCFLLWRRA